MRKEMWMQHACAGFWSGFLGVAEGGLPPCAHYRCTLASDLKKVVPIIWGEVPQEMNARVGAGGIRVGIELFFLAEG